MGWVRAMRVTCCLVGFAAVLAAGGAQAAPDRMGTGLFRGRPVIYHIVHGQKLFEGDIVLDHVTPLPQGGGGQPHPGIGVAYAQYLWPTDPQGVAEIPYTIQTAANNLSAALTAFNNTFPGIIQFVPYTNQPDYVIFNFDTTNGSGTCESSVGRVGGPQYVGGSYLCSLGTLLHEMGHVLGLYHEMTRPDRDSYISVNFNNVIKGSEDNFTQQGDNYQDLTLFDYGSVMMYIPFAFSRNGGPVLDTIPPGMPLSNYVGYTAADIDSVKRLYGAAPTQVTVTSNPPGLSVMVDGTSVTTPQSFTWALKSKHTLSVGADAQTLTSGGTTSTYIYGRWNDNTAASHTVTALPGNNTIAQPASSPAVTVYTANFVQLAAYTGSTVAGTGTVGVSPAPQSYPGVSGQYLVARQPVTITATPSGAYQFVTWGGVAAPYSANPKPDYVPDGGVPYSVGAYFSTDPITTISTNPGGFWFTVDGTYYKAPQNFAADVFSGWGAGSKHLVTGFSPNEPWSVNTRYLFDSWSDGGKLSHKIIVPTGASTLAATYTAQYVPIAYSEPLCAANVTIKPKSSGGFYNAGTVATVKAAANPTGLVPTGWTGDLSGKKPSQKLTINDEELAVATYNVTSTPFSLAALSPNLFVSGGAGGTVKIKGDGFAPSAAIFVNNTYRGSTYVSSKEIDVALTSADLTSAGAFPIGVSNYPSGGSCGNYAALTFFVANP